jgi:hypothetical protein
MNTKKIIPYEIYVSGFPALECELLKSALRHRNLAVRHKSADLLIEYFKDSSLSVFMKPLDDRDWYVSVMPYVSIGTASGKICHRRTCKSFK